MKTARLVYQRVRLIESWKQGQPASMANSPLAPIAQPPAPKAPGEIPVNKIKVPDLAAFGRILEVQPRQQAELALRFTF